MFHALSHFRATHVADSTAGDLNLAFEEETYDYKNAYPSMAQDAVEDDALEARHSLESIGPVITKLIGKAMSSPETDESGSCYVCPVCGNIEFGRPPAKCHFYGVDANDFVTVS
jgi:rubrerythrin